ncbi:MAG: hypothetical protein AAB612_00555 [Patescibacteria group bacterium]
MLTKQDIKTIESSMLKVFEQKFMPQLLRVFVTKEDLKQEFAKHDRKMDIRFERLEKRIDHMEKRMDERIDDANERMQEMQSTLNTVHLKLDQHIEDTSSTFTAHLRRIHELQGIPVSDKSKVAYTASTDDPKPKK